MKKFEPIEMPGAWSADGRQIYRRIILRRHRSTAISIALVVFGFALGVAGVVLG